MSQTLTVLNISVALCFHTVNIHNMHSQTRIVSVPFTVCVLSFTKKKFLFPYTWNLNMTHKVIYLQISTFLGDPCQEQVSKNHICIEGPLLFHSKGCMTKPSWINPWCGIEWEKKKKKLLSVPMNACFSPVWTSIYMSRNLKSSEAWGHSSRMSALGTDQEFK